MATTTEDLLAMELGLTCPCPISIPPTSAPSGTLRRPLTRPQFRLHHSVPELRKNHEACTSDRRSSSGEVRRAESQLVLVHLRRGRGSDRSRGDETIIMRGNQSLFCLGIQSNTAFQTGEWRLSLVLHASFGGLPPIDLFTFVNANTVVAHEVCLNEERT